jgi:hypothetical protein
MDAFNLLKFKFGEECSMHKSGLIAAAIIIGLASVCYAGPKGASGTPGATRGASEFSPGDQMRDKGTTGRGASEFTPGDRMRDAGRPKKGARGASEFSPGDQMNDKRGR